MEKVRVAYLTHILSFGGASQSLILMIESLKDSQFEKYVFASNSDEAVKYQISTLIEGFSSIPLREIHNHQSFRTSLQGFCKILLLHDEKPLIQLLLDKKINILHINATVLPHVYKAIKKKTNVKIVSHIRELIPKYELGIIQGFMKRRIFKYSDAIIAISNNEAEIFEKHKNLFIIPNPYNFNALTKKDDSIRTSYSISKETLLIGMIASFHKEKGHLDFLRTLKLLSETRKMGKNYRFVIIGFPDLKPISAFKRIYYKIRFVKDFRKEVIDYIQKNRLENMVLLIPFVQNALALVNSLDIVVRPAITADPWGRDIIEAMALKKPLIATGNSKFYVENGINGFLVPPKRPDKIAEKIETLILNDKLRITFGENAFNKIYNMCNLENYRISISKVYNSVL